MALDTYQDHYRKKVARSAGVHLDEVAFLERHGEIDPPVFSLKVEGRGPYFAMDVMHGFSVETFVIPHSDEVSTPYDVHTAYSAYLLKRGRG